MALSDFWALMKRNSKICVILPLICALAFGVVGGVMKGGAGRYSVDAPVFAHENTGQIQNLAVALAKDASAFPNATFSVADPNQAKIVITATAGTPAEAIDAANGIASKTVEAAQAAYGYRFVLNESNGTMGKVQIAAEDLPSIYYAQDASVSTLKQVAGGNGWLKYGLLGLIGGLFIAMFAVLIVDIVRRPARSRRQIESLLQVPVIGLHGKNGDSPERILANISFAADGREGEICLVNASPRTRADDLAECLRASGGDTIALRLTPSFAESMEGAFAARDACACALAVRQWADRLDDVEDALRELSFARANVAGIILCDEETAR